MTDILRMMLQFDRSMTCPICGTRFLSEYGEGGSIHHGNNTNATYIEMMLGKNGVESIIKKYDLRDENYCNIRDIGEKTQSNIQECVSKILAQVDTEAAQTFRKFFSRRKEWLDVMVARFPLATNFITKSGYVFGTNFMRCNPDELVVCDGDDSIALIGVKDGRHRILATERQDMLYYVSTIAEALNGKTVFSADPSVQVPEDMIEFYSKN
jgi:hypothetical protein